MGEKIHFLKVKDKNGAKKMLHIIIYQKRVKDLRLAKNIHFDKTSKKRALNPTEHIK